MKNHRTDDQPTRSSFSRRGFLQGASAAAATALFAPRLFPRAASAGPPFTIIHVFLRGAADGLSMCVPYNDAYYLNNRPFIKIPNAVDLDNYWGLAPALDAHWRSIWNDGDLAVIPAAGLADKNRSHFVAMRRVETGAASVSQGGPIAPTSGWATRHLEQTVWTGGGFTRGLVVGPLSTQTFLGSPEMLAIPDPANYQFPDSDIVKQKVGQMFENEPVPTGPAVGGALDAIDELAAIDFDGYVPAGGADYMENQDSFGDRFRKLAAIIRAGHAPQIAQIDLGGWDHHEAQAPDTVGGTMHDKMVQLARTIAAFRTDMKGDATHTNHWDDVAVYIHTEFGRRVLENASKGTDHGWAGCAFVLGGQRINGGVHLPYWGINQLASMVDSEGDLVVVTDWRNVAAELLTKLQGLSDQDEVFFDNFPYSPLGIVT